MCGDYIIFLRITYVIESKKALLTKMEKNSLKQVWLNDSKLIIFKVQPQLK